MLDSEKNSTALIASYGPRFSASALAWGEAFPHFWEHTVGSGHALLSLRADWQQQLRRAHDELGFKYVRFHGLLDDSLSTFLIQNDRPLYSFFNIDRIFDFLLSIGMKPFVELSFMPLGLSSGDKTVFHYKGNVTPPRDHVAWATLIGKLTQHLVDRYGADEVRQWFFEVWNEPNLEAFYTGKQEDYFKLYSYTAHAIKGVDSKLQVGGPATAMNAWVADFVRYCTDNQVPFDFVSTHHYPTDAFGKPGDDTETQLAVSRRSVLRGQAESVKREAGGKPVYYTEWSSSSNPRDFMHDDPYAAAFLVKTIMEATDLMKGYSWWTFSDIFEENYFPSVPFHGGFGLLNIYNIAKPSYRAFQLLHDLGDSLLPTEGSHETVDAWFVRKEKDITLLATNFALPRHPIKEQTVSITLRDVKQPLRLVLRRIDDMHANAKKLWQQSGSPEYLKAADVEALQQASALTDEILGCSFKEGTLTFSFSLPPQGVASITIEGVL